MDGVRHILSFGGGVNSVALMILLIREGAPLDEVVFADTGGEVPETYEYLQTTQDYLARHNIPFVVLSKRVGRDLYSTSWRRRVFPSAIWRWSTRDFKVLPILAHYRMIGGHINQYLAIAYDEVERMRDSAAGYVTNIYPLIDRKIKRSGCIEIIQQEGLPIPVKSGCYFCPFNSLERWKWLSIQHPDLYQKAIDLEENSKHYPSQRLTDQVFRSRASVTLRELPTYFHRLDVLSSHQGSPCGGECMT